MKKIISYISSTRKKRWQQQILTATTALTALTAITATTAIAVPTAFTAKI